MSLTPNSSIIPNNSDIVIRGACEKIVESSFEKNGGNLSGFLLFLAISNCIEEQEHINLGSINGVGSGIDRLVLKIADEYFTQSDHVIIIFDESWDINDIIAKLGATVSKCFSIYFVKTKDDPHKTTQILRDKFSDQEKKLRISNRLISKAYYVIIFTQNEKAFEIILKEATKYPWWSIRARLLVLVKEKNSEPTKNILKLLESERIFNGVVISEVLLRKSNTSIQNELLNIKTSPVFQIAAIDPYPPDGESNQVFVGKFIKNTLVTNRPIFMDKLENMRGFRLKICVVAFPPLVIKKEIGENSGNFAYSGLEVSILEQLAKYINFSYEIYEPDNRYGADYGNGSWSGLMGEVADNRAQIGFGSLFLLDNRESVLDVTDPYDQDAGCFAVPRPEALQHWLGLVLPFSWQVWACFLAMCLVAGPIFSFITRPLKTDKSISVGRGIMYALGSMVSVQQAPKAKSSALRAYIIAWLIFCWLSCVIYRVSLIVSLTIGPNDYKIDTIYQLAKSGLKWGGFIEVLKTFTNSSDKSEERLFDRFVTVTNMTAALEAVVDGDFAVLESKKFLQYAARVTYFNGHYSLIHIAKECPTIYNVGFVMPIGSPYYDRINSMLRRFQNAGLIEKWLRDIMYTAFLQNPNLKNKEELLPGLSLNDLKLCFVLISFGYFFGTLSLGVEKLIEKYKSHKLLVIEMKRERKESRLSQMSIRSVSSSVFKSDTNENIESIIDN